MAPARSTRASHAHSAPAVALAAALAAALALPVPASAKGYKEGDEVEITGTVTDENGRAVPGATVRLEASRSELALKRLSRVRRHPTRVETLTGDKGEYAITWPWHDYYNRFELMLGITVRDEDGDKFRELVRTDLSRRIRQGSPVVAPFVLTDASEVERNRAFLASVDSADERRVYEQMGTPDRVDAEQIGEREEATWWYFRAGRAYRFVAGGLDQVIPFEPVTSF